MSEGAIHICEMCRDQVERGEPGVVEAVELVPAATFGDPHGTAEGLHVFFHEVCFPYGSPSYRRVG